MAIHMYTGLPGSGKTYMLTKLALKYLKDGYEVACNYKINWEGNNLRGYESLSDLVDFKKGIIIMDEAQIYFNARRWHDLPEEWLYKLQQHRKDGLTILGSVQSINRLDAGLRELVSNYYECKLVLFKQLIQVKEYSIDDAKARKTRKALLVDWYPKSKTIFESYDTLQKIVIPVRTANASPRSDSGAVRLT